MFMRRLAVFCLCAALSWNALAQAAEKPRVDFVYFGASDCPYCRAWENWDLPKLQASETFQRVRFTKVTKNIRSPVPGEFWFPKEIKHLRDPIAEQLKGAGSPMFAILADGKVVLAWKGTRRGTEELIRIFEQQLARPAAGAAQPDS